jgi:hypothetical protein
MAVARFMTIAPLVAVLIFVRPQAACIRDSMLLT